MALSMDASSRLRHRMKVKQEDTANEKEAAEKKLKEIIGEVSGTDSGLLFLRYLMNTCGYQSPEILVNKDGQPMPEAMLYNSARRDVYVELRKFIPKEALIKLEIY